MPRFKDDLKGHYNNDDKADRAKSDEYLKTYDAINTNAPEFLDDQAKTIFAEMIHASKENTLKSIDAPLLATFSQIYSNVINAIQNINENGLVIDGKINPYERILNKESVQLKALAVELGITPNSRARIELNRAKNHKPEDQKDPFLKVMSNNG